MPVFPSHGSLRIRLLLYAGLFAGVGIAALVVSHRPSPPPPTKADLWKSIQSDLHALDNLEAKRNANHWEPEIQAQYHELVFIQLWDRMNRSPVGWDILRQLEFRELIISSAGPPTRLPHNIEIVRGKNPEERRDPARIAAKMQEFESQGYTIAQSEWRHERFDPGTANHPPRSQFRVTLHIAGDSPPERLIASGLLNVLWKPDKDPETLPKIDKLTLSEWTLARRRGPPAFEKVFEEDFTPPPKSPFIGPLIVYDFDADSRSDIALPGCNTLLWNHGEWEFSRAAFAPAPPDPLTTAVVADFNGDFLPDLLCIDRTGALLYAGTTAGHFPHTPLRVWPAPEKIRYGQVLTTADIDRDGDLDVFLGQYRLPYRHGQMPTPFFDARDGHPAYLLENRGNGTFIDITETSGLDAVRYRRIYSASFIDLDDNETMDLAVVSDFAGADFFLNDGRGRFSPMRPTRPPEWSAFGMSHAIADFNRDGQSDFLMIGMNSPTASRLDHLHLGDPKFPDYTEKRPEMTFGNRLLFGSSTGFLAAPIHPGLQKTGWSWGVTAADFDNNTTTDIFITNGHESRSTVRDFETQFWLHDIYHGTSKTNLLLALHFQNVGRRLRGSGYSYGGYEKNRFLLHTRSGDYIETAYLLGLASERDSRCAVSDDLDGDGRLDLLVTTMESWPKHRQSLLIYRNQLEKTGNWIGFRLHPTALRASPVGWKVILDCESGPQISRLVTGDSYRSQHPPHVHFGIGRTKSVRQAQFFGPRGECIRLNNPTINQIHTVTGKFLPSPDSRE